MMAAAALWMVSVPAWALVIAPSYVDVGAVEVGLTGTTEFTVTNEGGATSSINGITSANPQFSATPASFSLPALASQTVTVTFTPTVTGWESATLVVTHDGGAQTLASVGGTGTVVPVVPTGALNSTRIAFTVDGGVQTVHFDGSATEVLTTGETPDGTLAWSPDGARIAYSTGLAIRVLDVATGAVADLVVDAGDKSWCTWSPDSKKIAFRSDIDGAIAIYVVPVSGGTPALLTEGLASAGHPAWSPDGSQIAFVSPGGGGLNSIYVMDSDGSDIVPLTDASGFSKHSPAWHPDGTRIAFASDRTGNWDLSVMSADGGPATQLTANGSADEHPAWSPDGARLTVTTGRPGGGIWLLGAGPGGEAAARSLAPASGRSSWSTFSPASADPTVAIALPTEGQQLGSATSSTSLTISVANHINPGHWHWRLDSPFPAEGIAEGTHVDAGTLTDTIPSLVDGGSYTVYVALVSDAEHALIDATTNAAARASVSFTVGSSGVVADAV
ncbi:MAG: choice-of-anchor D domain-containing protein, partial [Candidatus Poribacteria bacterium]